MAYLDWDHRFSVGIREIDEQHKQIIAFINVLHEAIAQGRERQMMDNIIHELVDYASMHFRTEERYMTRNDFPGYISHESEHDVFIRKVLDTQRDLYQGERSVPEDLLQFLKDWLATHITGTDKQYAKFFRDMGVAL